MFGKNTLLSAAVLCCLTPIASYSEPVKLTSLEWPPYNGKNLPNQGTNTYKLASLLKSQGVEINVAFLPWNRATVTGLKDKTFVGVFPEYYRDDASCLWSDQFDTSTVGFVVKKGVNLDWNSVSDLEKYKIGVVTGYANDNGPFDDAIKTGKLKVEAVTNDALNVKKVAAGRIDAAVIDKKVLQFLLEGELSSVASKVQFDNKILIENGLFVCFQPDNPTAIKTHAALNEAIKSSK